MSPEPDFKNYTPELQKNARLVEDWYERICKSLDKCPFCDLREKYIIFEIKNTVLTVNLFPYVDGHLLIVPRKHFVSLSELSESDWLAVAELLRRADFLLKEVLGIKGYNFILREGEHGGKSLEHLHFHIIPFKEGLINWSYGEINEAPVEMAKRLRRALNGFDRVQPSRGLNPPCQKTVDGSAVSGRVEPSIGLNPKEEVRLMRRACLLCDRSRCLYKTGCLAVHNGEVILEAFNETLSGEKYCQDGECIRKKLGLKNGNDIGKVCTIHAEANLIAQAAARGISLRGVDIYVSTFPCYVCAKSLVKAEIGRLFYMFCQQQMTSIADYRQHPFFYFLMPELYY